MTTYGNILFLDCESVSIQDDRDYFGERNTKDWKKLQNDLIQIAFIDLMGNEYNKTIKPIKEYWNTKDWYGDKFNWEVVKDEKELDFYFYELEKILNGKTIVCHNVEFDKNLIEQSLANYNLSLPKNINWICTKDIYEERFNINNRRYSSLRRLTKQMGLYRASEHHDALADCNMLKDLFNSYMRKNYLEI